MFITFSVGPAHHLLGGVAGPGPCHHLLQVVLDIRVFPSQGSLHGLSTLKIYTINNILDLRILETIKRMKVDGKCHVDLIK